MTRVLLTWSELRAHLLPTGRWAVVRSYGNVLLTTCLALVLWSAAEQQRASSLFLLFVASVAISAWSGGLGPAVMAIGTSAIACLLLLILPSRPRVINPEQEILYFPLFVLVSLLIAGLQVARQRAQQALAHQALHDALTQLPNRRLIGDRLEHALQAAHRHDTARAVVLLDVDGFKAVNDTLGHATGDLLLQEISVRLGASVRASDTVARWGGDEFGLVLPESDEAGAIQSAERILDALSLPILLHERVIRIGASIGIAVYPDHGADSEKLLQAADAAMYRTKRAGGSSYALSQSPPLARIYRESRVPPEAVKQGTL